MDKYYNILFVAALICLAACLLFALIRSIRGPRIADRILGINMIGSLSLAAIAVIAVQLKQSWLLDVCLIYCMISFLSVVVLTKIHIADIDEDEGGDSND